MLWSVWSTERLISISRLPLSGNRSSDEWEDHSSLLELKAAEKKDSRRHRHAMV